jgi:thioester reductase-like protein
MNEDKIDVIYHAGAVVNWINSYSSLKQPNFYGTVEIVKFAIHKKLKTVHYVSTIGVAGTHEHQFISADHIHLLNGYSKSKYVAEKFISHAASQGIPVSIYRPGMISGTGTSCIVC